MQLQPERLMTTAELCYLTGEHRNTVQRRFRDGGEWFAAGVVIGKEYRLPVSAWNAWVRGQRISQQEAREA